MLSGERYGAGAIVLGLVLCACGGSVDDTGSGGSAGAGADGGNGGSAGAGAFGGGGAGGAKTALPTGYYYFVFDLDYLAVQLQAYTYLDVNADQGTWQGLFTNANRREALNSRPGCPSCPPDTPICALVPIPRCVKPSLKQGSLDEYVDFLPEPDPPNGYTFVADGMALDNGAATKFGSAPFLIEVLVGGGGISVRAEGTRIAGSFQKGAEGRWLGTGSVSVDVVKLNGNGQDPTQGTFQAMTLSADEVTAVESFGYPIPKLP